MKRKEFIQSSSLLIAGTLIARDKLFDIENSEVVYGQNEKTVSWMHFQAPSEQWLVHPGAEWR